MLARCPIDHQPLGCAADAGVGAMVRPTTNAAMMLVRGFNRLKKAYGR
jgi:hypothetical protein